jgi:hypothetical protein
MSSSTFTTTPLTAVEPTRLVQTRVTDHMANFPWWGLVLVLMAVFLIYRFLIDATYQEIIPFMIVGIRLTIQVILIAFVITVVYLYQIITLILSIGDIYMQRRMSMS